MGDLVALASAFCWAGANVMIARGVRDTRGADNGAFLSILLTVALSAAVWLFTGLAISRLNLAGMLWFALAGAMTIFVGRLLLYSSFRRLGAVRGASLKRMAPFFSVLLGVSLLGDRITPGLLAGMVLILCGIAALIYESQLKARASGAIEPVGSFWQRWFNPGFIFGTVSALAYALGNVARKYGVAELPDPVFGTLFGALAGTALFVLAGLVAPSYRTAVKSTFTQFRPWLLAGGFFGSAGQLLFFVAIDLSTVSRAALIASSEVFLTILLSVAIFRHERLTRWVVIATVLGALGTVAIVDDRDRAGGTAPAAPLHVR